MVIISAKSPENSVNPTVDSQTSVTKVIGDEDLLTEILLRLPPKHLLQLQCVCKSWFLLISSRRFRLLHSRRKKNSGTVDGLFFCWWVYRINNLDFTPLNGIRKRDMSTVPCSFQSIPYPCSKIERLHSCNGLFCVSFNLGMGNQVFYVYNPSTNQHRLIPPPNIITKPREVMIMNLAFDPSVSDSYRLVCVVKCGVRYEFSVYSPETGVWMHSMESLDAGEYFFGQGVFMDGYMHWVSETRLFLRFDLDSVCFRTMPSTVIPVGFSKRNIRYFGQSGGHLHLVEVYEYRSMVFEVLEMEKDYSRWFVKYRVDLSALLVMYPLSLSEELDLVDVNRRTCNVLYIAVDDKVNKATLLVCTPDVFIQYDVHGRTIKEVSKVDSGKIPVMWEDVSVFEWCDTHLYLETMAFV